MRALLAVLALTVTLVACEDDTDLKCQQGQRAITTRDVPELVALDDNGNGWICVDLANYPTVAPDG